MKIRISKENLMKAIQIVSRAVSGKTTMSILQCILINASGTEICLIANDMELGIQTVAQGIILEGGNDRGRCTDFLQYHQKASRQ